MPIAASASILSNTGAADLPYGLQWGRATFSGGTGDNNQHQAKWATSLPASGAWSAKKWRNHPFLETAVDVLTDFTGYDLPVLPEAVGSLSLTPTVKDGTGASNTATAATATIAALSGYTNIYLDASSTATGGTLYSALFGDAVDTAVASVAAAANPFNFGLANNLGTFTTNGTGALRAATQDGAGMAVCTMDPGQSSVTIEATIQMGNRLDRAAGIVARYGGGASWLIVGLNPTDNTVVIYNRATATDLHTAAFTVALDTSYKITLIDDGTDMLVYVDDTLYITASSESTYAGNTAYGIGGRAANSAGTDTIWEDFSFKLTDSGAGTSTSDEISDINVFSALANRALPATLVHVASGTYTPTTTIPLRGTNVVFRWADGATRPVINMGSLPQAGAAITIGSGSETARRVTVQGIEFDDSSVVSSDFDGSSASVVSVGDDTIVVSAAFYAACSTEDPVRYINIVGGALGGVTAEDTQYYIIKTGTANTVKLATSAANAGAGTAVNITALSNGTDHKLILGAGRKVIAKGGVAIDFCAADCEFAADLPAYAMNFLSDTWDSTSRIAAIRCNLRNYSTLTYCYGFFGDPTVALIDCGAGSTTSERPMRVDSAGNRFTLAYCGWRQQSYSGRNPARLQSCALGSVYGCWFAGTAISFGGDTNNALQCRVEQSILDGIDVYDGSTPFVVSCLITDEYMKSIAGAASAPAGAEYGGTAGLNRNSTHSAAMTVTHCTLLASGVALENGNSVFGVIQAGTNIDSVDINNCILTFSGSTSSSSASALRLDGTPTVAIFSDNYMPPAASTALDTGKVGNLAAVNVNATQWEAATATSNTTFEDITLNAYYYPASAATRTIPNGVHSDFFGNELVPGGSAKAGAVSVDATPAAATNRSRVRDGLRSR